MCVKESIWGKCWIQSRFRAFRKSSLFCQKDKPKYSKTPLHSLRHQSHIHLEMLVWKCMFLSILGPGDTHTPSSTRSFTHAMWRFPFDSFRSSRQTEAVLTVGKVLKDSLPTVNVAVSPCWATVCQLWQLCCKTTEKDSTDYKINEELRDTYSGNEWVGSYQAYHQSHGPPHPCPGFPVVLWRATQPVQRMQANMSINIIMLYELCAYKHRVRVCVCVCTCMRGRIKFTLLSSHLSESVSKHQLKLSAKK